MGLYKDESGVINCFLGFLIDFGFRDKDVRGVHTSLSLRSSINLMHPKMPNYRPLWGMDYWKMDPLWGLHMAIGWSTFIVGMVEEHPLEIYPLWGLDLWPFLVGIVTTTKSKRII